MREKKNNKKIKIINIIQILLILLFIYSTINIVLWTINNHANKDVIAEINKSVEINNNAEEKYKINFEELKQKNSDTIAWLKVENTRIKLVGYLLTIKTSLMEQIRIL